MAKAERISEMERLVLRLPSDVRDSLALRADLHGRSMNAEATLILKEALERPHRLELERFQYEYDRITREIATLRKLLEQGEERKNALVREMESRHSPQADDTPR